MNHKGFTLIELVMVLVLIGIIAVFAAPKLGNVTSTNAAAFVDKLRADIRYAQNLAMTRGKRTRIFFTPASYTIYQDASVAGDCTGVVTATDPAIGGPYMVVISVGQYAGITLGYSRQYLEFDSLGRPWDWNGLGLGPCSTTPGGMTVTVLANGTAVGTVRVYDQTGSVNY